MEEEKKEDVKLTKVTEADVAQLGIILQTCARANNWIVSGIAPDKNCKKCLGTGQMGRNTKLDYYLLCPCILSQIQEAMKFMFVIKAQIEQDKKGDKNGAGESGVSTKNITDVEEGQISGNE